MNSNAIMEGQFEGEPGEESSSFETAKTTNSIAALEISAGGGVKDTNNEFVGISLNGSSGTPDISPNSSQVGNQQQQQNQRGQESALYCRNNDRDIKEDEGLSPRWRDSQQVYNLEVEDTSSLTTEDRITIQKLDEEYDLALIEREIGWNARYFSVRQNAGLSLWFMFVFLLIGTIVFEINTEWTTSEALLFSIYTITTVGYGNHEIPSKPSLLVFISFYIFFGIATLTIMAAQAYEWIVLEFSRLKQKKDKEDFLERHEQNMKNAEDLESVMADDASSVLFDADLGTDDGREKTWRQTAQIRMLRFVNWLQRYLKDNHVGQLIAVLLPFAFVILIGALFVGSIQRWTFIESVYFAVVSLTTVGYGDFYPTKLSSTWFCIFWLPLSVGFLSLYLSSIARFYIHISSKNVKRVEQRLRRRVYQHRAIQQRERREAMERLATGGFGVENEETSGIEAIQDPPSHIQRSRQPKGFDEIPTNDEVIEPLGFEHGDDLPSSPVEDRNKRRDEIQRNSGYEQNESNHSMRTMNDVIHAVKTNMKSNKRSHSEQSSTNVNDESGYRPTSPKRNLLSVQSTTHYSTPRGVEKKPSFALRVLVQERLSGIIAHEIAGYQSSVSIKENTLRVTIMSLKETNEKWKIPKRATRAFRAVAFEALYYVGERDLIVKGPDALFALSPSEVQSIFGPVLAAMGDADTMEAWLSCTNDLANMELNFGKKQPPRKMFNTFTIDEGDDDKEPEFTGTQMKKFDQIRERRESQLSANATASPRHQRSVIGNAVNNQD